ncbi:MAG: hypothetical protein GX358_00830 [candidate division WS1 bacterium]|nr:hypothetical protein [candidate division WS1 bacterium]
MYSIAISIAREGGVQGQQSSQSSFFAMIYEELIPSDHLLRQTAKGEASRKAKI